MLVREHARLSAGAALLAWPYLGRKVWIPLAASLLIDADHYMWHAVTHRTLSVRAALAYFGQADPPQRPEARLLHHPLTLAGWLAAAAATRSRGLWLALAGLHFHVSLDLVHSNRLASLKRKLAESAEGRCPRCGRASQELQLHTLRVVGNPLDRYHPRHFAALCPPCHAAAHAKR